MARMARKLLGANAKSYRLKLKSQHNIINKQYNVTQFTVAKRYIKYNTVYYIVIIFVYHILPYIIIFFYCVRF